MKLQDLPQFEQGYFTAAFWTSDDDAPGGCDYSTTGRADDLFARLHPDNLNKQLKQCAEFKKNLAADIAAVEDDFQAGVDFWLTRNHHGSGFWDRDYSHLDPAYAERVKKRLTMTSHAYGEVYCSLDDEESRAVYIE